MPAYRIKNNNVLFIHVPKTGGTTVETFLAPTAPMSLHSRGGKLLKPARKVLSAALPLQHFHAELLEAMFAPGFFDYAFMIVREPVERLKSEYRYARALRRPSSHLSFDAWLNVELTLASIDPYRRSNHFRPQAEFACFNAEVFRFEDGIGNILAKLGEKLELPPIGEVPHKRRSDDLVIDVSARGLSRIHRFYEVDYQRFGALWNVRN